VPLLIFEIVNTKKKKRERERERERGREGGGKSTPRVSATVFGNCSYSFLFIKLFRSSFARLYDGETSKDNGMAFETVSAEKIQAIITQRQRRSFSFSMDKEEK
jgi:hypothetical protein